MSSSARGCSAVACSVFGVSCVVESGDVSEVEGVEYLDGLSASPATDGFVWWCVVDVVSPLCAFGSVLFAVSGGLAWFADGGVGWLFAVSADV